MLESVDGSQLTELAGYVTEVVETQEPIFKEAISDDEFVGFLMKNEIRAFAGLPLLTTRPHGMRATVGVLFVNFTKPHPFSEENREILQHLANQAAVAVAYAEARASSEANEQLAALGQAAATLQHRLGNTINITVPAVMRLRYRLGHDPVTAGILDTIERNTLFANEVVQRMQTPLRPEPYVLTNINSLLHGAILQCVEQAGQLPQIRLMSNLADVPVDLTSDPGLDVSQISIEASLFPELPETYSMSAASKRCFECWSKTPSRPSTPMPVKLRSSASFGLAVDVRLSKSA